MEFAGWLAYIAVGVGLLVWSADRFLTGAIGAANRIGVSPLLIGLTAVSVGTSGPEIVVAALASVRNTPDIAIGNAIGSNIANIGLVLGITALFRPLPFARSVLNFELRWLIAATVISVICISGSALTRLDGMILLFGLLILMWQLIQGQRKESAQPKEVLGREELNRAQGLSGKKSVWLFLSGLVILLLSAELLVWSATGLARALDVPELVIGLTVIAVGTSLPELTATLGGALKGQPDLAIGNIVGSNILNILAILAIPALISAPDTSPETLWRDLLTMVALTVMLVFFAYGFRERPSITPFEGLVLVVTWVAYNALLYHQNTAAV